jgi:NAD(P)H-quinone oxidoreductase subunit 5
MAWLLPSLLATTVLALLASGLFPWQRLNRAAQRSGWATIWLTIVALQASLAASVHVMIAGTIDYSFVAWKWPVPGCLGVYVDAVSGVMLVLISFIGLIIARYASRYLQGDANQGEFFRWMALTLGATLMLVMACNLVMLTAAWMLISFGLHQLLTYYPERTWGVWAARKKFLISRLGDALLFAALVLTYRCFGTTEYTDIFAAAHAIHEGKASGSITADFIGILFVLGAMTKSAQFPFHSWLPDTMETPTPVSALMHAGVINAGGFLVIRLSPLVSLSPSALDLLAILGATTALLGSLVMLTQTSIKRSLAYSTIAQMGFMMLQCGLGAFSAALLHIVAHSAYKAHAFLSCGSVLDAAARTKAPPLPSASGSRKLLAFVAAFALSVCIVALAIQILGSGISAKPGGVLLGFISSCGKAWPLALSGRQFAVLPKD